MSRHVSRPYLHKPANRPFHPRIFNTAAAATPSRWITATYQDGGGVLAMRFDDGRSIDYTTTFPELVARGLIGGFPVISGNIAKDANYMTAAQILELQAAGMEIENHSRYHTADPADDAAFMVEAIANLATLKALGLDVAAFVQPGSWVVNNAYNIYDTGFYGGAADLALRANYNSYEGYIANSDNAGYFNLPLGATKRWGWSHQTFSSTTFTMAQKYAWVDNAIVQQQAFECLWHVWELDGGGYETLANFLLWLNYVQRQKARGWLSVLTPTQLQYATPAGTALQKIMLFADQETGTLDQWTSSSDTGGNITCTAGAALRGSAYGLNINLPNTTVRYVQKTLAAGDTTGKLRVRFYIDPNTLTMATGDILIIMRTYDTAANQATNVYLYKSATSYQLRATLVDDTGTAVTSTAFDITDAPHYAEFYLQRAASAGSSDGSFQVWIDGVSKQTLTGVDNYHRFDEFKYLRVGAIVFATGSPTGAFFVDEIVANNTGTQIGA